MCLGVPGKITELYEVEGITMGKVDFGGVVREACFDFIEDPQIGEYAVIHVGFAISRLSEEEARDTLALLNEIADLDEELGIEHPSEVPS